MTILERKIDVCLRFITATNTDAQLQAMLEARELLRSGDVHDEGMLPAITVRQKAEELLTEVGVPCSLLGYRYLTYALVLAVDNSKPALHGHITSQLYPTIAGKCNTTKTAVERGIRHAVEYTFDNSDIEVLTRLFGNSISKDKGKATNAQFITTLAKELRWRIYGG